MATDTSLIFKILAVDDASKKLAKVRAEAVSTKAVLGAALGPGLLPILAASTAGVIGLGAALSGVGAAGAVFGAVFKTSFSQVQQAGQKTDALREKVRLLGEEARIAPTDDMRGKYLQQQAKAAIELQARLNMLPPATRNVVTAYGGLKTAWSNFVDQNKPQTYAIMTGGFSLLSRIIPKLQPLFDVAAGAVRRLLGSLTAASSGGGIQKVVGWLSDRAGPAISALIGIVKNLGSVFVGAFKAFAPTGQGILTWANMASARLARLSSGGGLQAFAAYATSQGPKVVALLTTIAGAAVNIVKGVSPLAPISLAIAGALTALIAAVPPAVITALVAAFVAYGVAMKIYYGYTVLVSAATKIWAGVQWLLNAAMDANPIGLIILAVAALAAGIWYLWTHSDGFRKFFIAMWNDIWGFLKSVGGWFAGPFASFFVRAYNAVRNATTTAVNWVHSKWSSFINFFTSMPGKISSIGSRMWNGISSAFRGVINSIIRMWNSLHFSVPGFSFLGMNVGGFSLGVPKLPYMAAGGDVRRGGFAMVGERGPEPVYLPAGASVASHSSLGSAMGRGGTVRVESAPGDQVAQMLLSLLRPVIRGTYGGDVNLALGGRKA